MKKRTATLGFIIILTVASVSSLLVKVNLTYATVICVDKNDNTKVLPCSDTNAIDKNSLITSRRVTNNNNATPNEATMLKNKGLSLAKLGNYTQAIQYYDKALAIDPKDVDALDDKGNGNIYVEYLPGG